MHSMCGGGGKDGDGRGDGGGYLGEGNSPPRCRIPKTICCDDGITMEREAASADQARGGRGRGGGRGGRRRTGWGVAHRRHI